MDCMDKLKFIRQEKRFIYDICDMGGKEQQVSSVASLCALTRIGGINKIE